MEYPLSIELPVHARILSACSTDGQNTTEWIYEIEYPIQILFQLLEELQGSAGPILFPIPSIPVRHNAGSTIETEHNHQASIFRWCRTIRIDPAVRSGLL